MCSDFSLHNNSAFRIFFKLVSVYCFVNTNHQQIGHQPLLPILLSYLKRNQNAPSRPSEHPPVMGEKMSKRLGGIKSCKYKTSSWHFNRFPDANNIGSTV